MKAAALVANSRRSMGASSGGSSAGSVAPALYKTAKAYQQTVQVRAQLGMNASLIIILDTDAISAYYAVHNTITIMLICT